MDGRFIFGDDNTNSIEQLLTSSAPLKCAVAFWGDRAKKYFPQGEMKAFQLICNLESGGTNPKFIRWLWENDYHLRIKTNSKLHAKVYLTPDSAIVGSANVSANGLSFEDDEVLGWLEASTVVNNRSTLDGIGMWFDSLWQSSSSITEELLQLAEIRWNKRRNDRGYVNGQSRSLIDAFIADPESFKDRRIFFALWTTRASQQALDAFDTAKKLGVPGTTANKLDFYENWDDLPEDAYLIDLRYDEQKRRGIYPCLYKTFQPHISYRISRTRRNIILCAKVKNLENQYVITEADKKLLRRICGTLWNIAEGHDDAKTLNLYAAKAVIQLALETER